MDRPEDISMMLFRGTQRTLASREIALALAGMVLKEYYGEEEFKAQQPLKITETPDSWVIEGSREYEFESTPHGRLAEGKVEVEILKINCQVIKIVKFEHFPSV